MTYMTEIGLKIIPKFIKRKMKEERKMKMGIIVKIYFY